MKIAFLGLGNMGSGMAARLIGAGHDVCVYNRTESRAEPLIKLGARPGKSPKDTAQNAEAVFVMVGDDIASRSMWLGDDGILSAPLADNALCIECSTLSHDWVLELSSLVASAGHRYLDCPVTGWPEHAARGELTFFVGGSIENIDDLRPIAAPLVKEIVRFGDVGAGSAYKLIVNLMGSIHIAAAAEGMLVAKAAGLDLDLVAEMLGKGGSGSPQCARNARIMADGTHAENNIFNGHWRHKDTLYGQQFAHKMGVNPTVGDAALEVFQKLIDRGWGQLSESMVMDAIDSNDPKK